MQQAVPKEGLRAPLFFTCFCLASFAAAQSVSQEDLQRCSQLVDAAAKLQCFEELANPPAVEIEEAVEVPEAVETEVLAPAAAAAVIAAEEAVTETPAVADEAAGDVPAEAVLVDDTPAEVVPADEPPAVAVEGAPAKIAAVDDPPAQEAAVAAASASAMPEEMGSEHLKQPGEQDETDENVIATVNDVTLGYGRRLTFHFENGQVWRQRNKDFISYPKDEPFDVEISRGMMGDYRLRVGGEGRMTRIVRVE